MRRLIVPAALPFTLLLALAIAASVSVRLVGHASRVATDEVIRAIGELPGQEHVQLYASDVKTRLAAGDGGV